MAEKQYRVWNVINPPREGLRYPVASPEDGLRLINFLSLPQLEVDWVVSNAFGLEVLTDSGEWEEWENDDGDDVDAAFPDIGPTRAPVTLTHVE